MSQSLSIRFQPPAQLTGPTKDLFALLKSPIDAGSVVRHEERVEPLALPPSAEQERLNVRLLRQKLRKLEKERALRAVDGSATWIITDRMSLDPDLGERVDDGIVGAGLGKGRIFYGPPDLCLPSGFYMAIIEFQVTDMLDSRWARVTGEVILSNRQYLSQQTKTISGGGPHTFRLPFRVRESDLFRHPTPMIEVRLNLKSIVGVKVTQIAVVSATPGLRSLVAHPAAHLHSAGNRWLKWLGRKFTKPRA